MRIQQGLRFVREVPRDLKSNGLRALFVLLQLDRAHGDLARYSRLRRWLVPAQCLAAPNSFSSERRR